MQKQILDRIQSNNELYIVSALRVLKSIVEAFQFEIEVERKPLDSLVTLFFPVIEQSILGSQTLSQSSNYIPIMCLICKIFYICNQVKIFSV